MVTWTPPVCDRTQEDVEFAKEKIAEWIASDIARNPLVVYDLKGCLNVSDINRIEGNIAYLSENLSKYAYPSSTSSKIWNASSIPNERDIKRIVQNVNLLISAYHVPLNAPYVPGSMTKYDEINAIERNLELIKELLDVMIASFKKSGVTKMGATTSLPLRR